LIEVHEKSADFQFDIDINTASNLVTALTECSEWCQTFIMEGLMFVVPQEPGEAEGLIDRLTPRLQHANSGVVLTAIKVILYLMNYIGDSEMVGSIYRKLAPPLGLNFH
jgi:vesicle coat complex subunit